MRFLAIFVVVAITETTTFFWVQTRIGLAWALGLALATALIGSFLVRRAGVSVIRRIKEKAGQAVLPGRELSEGAAILVAGAFLISPGFITDVLGFVLLIPAVRHWIHRIISRRFSGAMTVFAANRGKLHRDRSGATGAGDGWGDDIIDIDPNGLE